MISVIYSFRNEEQNLQELIDRTVKVCKKININYEIIFVNDASTDNSDSIINEHIKKNKNIKIISMTRTFGNTPCLIAGFKYSSGNFVTYLDADLQDPPELIYEMYEKAIDGFDVVHSVRNKRKGESSVKLLLTKIAYLFINKIVNVNLKNNSGDFKLLSKKVVKKILELDESEIYFRGVPSWTGYKEEYVYYNRGPRSAGTTKYPLNRSLNPYREIFRAISSFSEFPVFLSLATSILFFLITMILIFYSLISSQINNLVLLIIIFLSFGLVFTILTLQNIFIFKILMNTLKRPKYIIRDTKGFENYDLIEDK